MQVKLRYPLIGGILCRSSDIGVETLAEEVVQIVRKKIARKQNIVQVTNKNHIGSSIEIPPASISIELGDLEEAKATTLLRQFTNPKTLEVRQAAYSELYTLCSKKRCGNMKRFGKS